MEDAIEMPEQRRNPVLAVIITLILGVCMGYMYAGFVKRGVLLYAIQLSIVFVAMLLMNVNAMAGTVVLAAVVPFIVFVFVDVVRMSRKGTRQYFHQWYYYLTAFLLVRIVEHVIPAIIKSQIALAFFVPTGGMEPNILPGDRVMGGVLAAKVGEPKRGDIIAFIGPDSAQENKTPYVKRVVAVGGDSVEIKNGRVMINNKPEKPVAGVKSISYPDFPRVRVPDNHYFVLGDKRANSYDSRHWKKPYVPRENLRAVILIRFWPLSRFGKIY